MCLKLDYDGRYKTVALLSALVSIGIITIEEFTLAMIGLEDVYLEEDNVSEGFLLKLTDYYLGRV